MCAQVLAAVQLITRKPRTRPELAKLLGCTRQTVDIYIKLMLAEGLVEQIGTQRQERTGPPAALYGWSKVEVAAC